MIYRINPAFERFPEEGNLVGFILSSFGELELTFCGCAHVALRLDNWSVYQVLISYEQRLVVSTQQTA
jgi:hypothetical protein